MFGIKQIKRNILVLTGRVEKIEGLGEDIAHVDGRIDTVAGVLRREQDATRKNFVHAIGECSLAADEVSRQYTDKQCKSLTGDMNALKGYVEEMGHATAGRIESLESAVGAMDHHVQALTGALQFVAPEKPVELNREAVHAFLKATDDAGYDAFRKGVLAQAVAAGREGQSTQQQAFGIDGRALYHNGYHVYARSCENAFVIPSGGAHITVTGGTSYVCKDSSLAEQVLASVKSEVKVGKNDGVIISKLCPAAMKEKVLRSNNWRLSENAGIDFRSAERGIIVSVVYETEDTWGARLAEEVGAIHSAVAYGALERKLGDGDLKDAAAIYNAFFKDAPEGQFTADLAKIVEAYPQITRYLAPTMDAMRPE